MEQKSDFKRFWRANGVNLIVALVITLVICGFVGVQHYAFSLPVWLVIGVVCWLARMAWLYHNWKRDNPEDEQ